LRSDKGPPAVNRDLERLRQWYEGKSPIWTTQDEQEPKEDLKSFIHKYLAQDEIAQGDINYRYRYKGSFSSSLN
jgi:hypothetical protein